MARAEAVLGSSVGLEKGFRRRCHFVWLPSADRDAGLGRWHPV